MWKISPVVVLLLVAALQISNGEQVPANCVYSMLDNDYMCKFASTSARGIESEDDVSQIDGDHLEDKGDEHVVRLRKQLLSTEVPFIQTLFCQKYKNVKYIEFQQSTVKEITENSFKGCTNVVFLNLANNNLVEIRANAFTELVAVADINMPSNKIETIEAGAFDSLVNLKSMSFASNKLTQLDKNLFRNNKKLIRLEFSRNAITSLDVDLFQGLSALKSIDVSRNFIDELSPAIFDGLEALESLHLFSNNLKEIPDYIFRSTPNLAELNISYNEITRLDATAFFSKSELENSEAVTKLRHFYAFTDKIEAIDPRFIDILPKNVAYIWLEGNACVNKTFSQIRDKDEEILPHLEECFRNYQEQNDAEKEPRIEL